MYTAYLSASAENIYNGLRGSDLKKINKGLHLIERSPLYYPGKIIPLKEPFKGKYRCKEGKWRIIYTVNVAQKEINVLTICTRSNVPY